MRLAVLKSPVAKQDLERLALQQIRSFPGGEHVIRAEVEYQSDPRKDIGSCTLLPRKAPTLSASNTRQEQRPIA